MTATRYSSTRNSCARASTVLAYCSTAFWRASAWAVVGAAMIWRKRVSTRGSISTISQPCAISVSRPRCMRGLADKRLSAASASVPASSSDVCIKRASTCETAAISAATFCSPLNCLPMFCPVCVKYLKEFCSRALSDLKYSTRVSFCCNAAVKASACLPIFIAAAPDTVVLSARSASAIWESC